MRNHLTTFIACVCVAAALVLGYFIGVSTSTTGEFDRGMKAGQEDEAWFHTEEGQMFMSEDLTSVSN